jgi:prevent-host-death family protein
VVKRLSTREARANFSEVVGMVYYTKEPVIVERKGKPYAVMISPEHFAALQQEDERTWQLIDEMRHKNAEFDPDAIEADVAAEVEAVRRQHDKEERPPGQRRS